MRNMKDFLPLLLLGIHVAIAERHSLQYFYTGTTGLVDFPKFIAVGIVDGEHIDYYDSISQKNVLKQAWMEGARDENTITETRKGHQEHFQNNIKIAMDRFNQTGGVHTVQYMYGCEWDDETGATQGIRQCGYDGEDFLVYDMKTFTWIAPKTQAEITQRKLNSDTAGLQFYKSYITEQCVEWLKKYVNYGKSVLERKVSPEVSLWQKDPSSPVVCHATGFYPRLVMLSWQKNGQELSDDVDLRETLQNEDGTFQKSSVLSLKPEEWNKKPEVYSCLVQHGGKDITVRLNMENVKRNPDPTGSNTLPIIIGIVAVAVILIAAVVGVFMWKKSRSGYGKTSTSETDSENSDRPMQKA